MLVFWRSLLMAWLVLALPLQGLASATGVLCSLAHAGAAQGGDGLRASAHGSTPAASAADVHAACAEAQAASAGPEASAGDLADPACSACAACCATGALLHTAPAVPDGRAAPTLFAADEPGVAHVAAGGPDRPPRSP